MQIRLTLLLGGALAVAVVAGISRDPPRSAPPELHSLAPMPLEDHSRVILAFSQRAGLREAGNDLFATPAAPARAIPGQALPNAGKPVPPPVPYKLVGTVTIGGATEYVLTMGDLLVQVRVGDVLDGRYRVEAGTTEEITLVYIPLEATARLGLVPPTPGNATIAVAAPRSVVPEANPRTALEPPAAVIPGAPVPAPIAETSDEVRRTAAIGSRAAHLRRERAQLLGRIIP